MKTVHIIAAISAWALLAPFAAAEDAVIVATAPSEHGKQAEGTVAQFGENFILVRAEASETPVQYRVLNATRWTDESGNPARRELFRVGMPVTVHYITAAGGFLATRIVVNHERPAAITRVIPATRQPSPDAASSTTSSTESGGNSQRPAAYDRADLAFAAASVGPTPKAAAAARTEDDRTPVDAAQLAPSAVVPGAYAPPTFATRAAPPPPVRAFRKVTGTVSYFGDGYLAMLDEDTGAPVQYHFSDTTRWLDDAGRTVDRESARKGADVTLLYVPSGQDFAISQAVVHRAPIAAADDGEEPAPTFQYRRRIAGSDAGFAERRGPMIERRPTRTILLRPRPEARRAPTLFDRIFRPRVATQMPATDLQREMFDEAE